MEQEDFYTFILLLTQNVIYIFFFFIIYLIDPKCLSCDDQAERLNFTERFLHCDNICYMIYDFIKIYLSLDSMFRT